MATLKPQVLEDIEELLSQLIDRAHAEKLAVSQRLLDAHRAVFEALHCEDEDIPLGSHWFDRVAIWGILAGICYIVWRL